MTQPRTRDNRLQRDAQVIDEAHVGDDSMPETCPRCGWPCTHTVVAYWDSPWNEHGGICSQCIREAVANFERNGWPPEPAQDTGPQVEIQALWNDED